MWVNATISAADPAEVALQARTAVDAGHRAIKLKVAAWPLNQDMMRIVSAWQACGSAELRLDANQGWTRTQADEALRVARDHGIECEVLNLRSLRPLDAGFRTAERDDRPARVRRGQALDRPVQTQPHRLAGLEDHDFGHAGTLRQPRR